PPPPPADLDHPPQLGEPAGGREARPPQRGRRRALPRDQRGVGGPHAVRHHRRGVGGAGRRALPRLARLIAPPEGSCRSALLGDPPRTYGRTVTRRAVRMLAVLGLGALIAVGCTGDDDGDDTGATSTTTSVETTTTTAALPDCDVAP